MAAFHPLRNFGSEFSMTGIDPKRTKRLRNASAEISFFMDTSFDRIELRKSSR